MQYLELENVKFPFPQAYMETTNFVNQKIWKQDFFLKEKILLYEYHEQFLNFPMVHASFR